jgi:DMATS type aromatic prenyltransferase
MNSVKVYFRTQATSLVELIDYLTFGNHLDVAAERDVVEAVDSLRRLWQLLFPGVGDDVSLRSRAPKHFATGFLIYYDLSPRTPYSLPKVNINVKHYCANDQAVASAIAQYYRHVGCRDLGDSYERNLRSL